MSMDYRAIDIPGSKDPEEYTYHERRAELLMAVERAGSPKLLNYARMGRRYGVSRETIRKDIKRLGEYIEDMRDGPENTLEVESFLWSCAQNLQEEGEYRKAAQTMMDLEEWRHQEDLADLMERIEALEQGRTGGSSGENPFQLK